MSDLAKRIEINQAFLISNGTKTGKFIVYDQDFSVNFHANSIKAESNLGKFFLRRFVDDSVFLLETMKNVFEGFWIVRSFTSAHENVDTSKKIIEFGADRNAVPNRIDGHLVRGHVRLGGDEPNYWLSEMEPNYRGLKDFYTFATKWPAIEWDTRRNAKELSEESITNMRELKQNLSLDIDRMRERAKMIPLLGIYNSDRKKKRYTMVDIAENLVRIASQNELDELITQLSEATIFLDNYLTEYGEDVITEFLSARISVLSTLVSTK